MFTLEEVIVVAVAFLLGLVIQNKQVKEAVEKITGKAKRVKALAVGFLGDELYKELVYLLQNKTKREALEIVQGYNEQEKTNFDDIKEVAIHYAVQKLGGNLSEKKIKEIVDLLDEHIDKLF